jgi:hypothetical protein
MSTTWVFLGLLGGREIAIALNRYNHEGSIKGAFKIVTKDLGYATFGLIISMLIAINVNEQVREQFLNLIKF